MENCLGRVNVRRICETMIDLSMVMRILKHNNATKETKMYVFRLKCIGAGSTAGKPPLYQTNAVKIEG